MDKKDYLKNLELKSILKYENEIESVLIIKNKYFVVKSLNEISIYFINTNKLKFRIPLNKKTEKFQYNYLFKKCIFDYNYKLRIINNEEKPNKYKFLTDKHLIEINFKTNKWKIIKEIKDGIFLLNLDVFTFSYKYNSIHILDQKGKLKKKIKDLAYPLILCGLYELKNKFLIINLQLLFIILDLKNNYEILYSKKKDIYENSFKNPRILDEQTIIFSAYLNCYVTDAEKFTFFDLNNFSERKVYSISYNLDGDYDYESGDKLFIIHKFDNNTFLQFQTSENYFGKKWSIVELKVDKKFERFIFVKKFDDRGILGDNVYFLPDNLIITWDFIGKTIKFVHYE